MPISADDVRTLHKYDIRILRALERLMKRYMWVPDDILRHATKLSESELDYRLGHLMAKNLVKSSSLPYKGYQMVFAGFDALALQSLTKKGSVRALGSLLGVGKESDVYEAMGFGAVVLKFHRVGQRSFQSVRLNRGYMPEYKHAPWIFVSSLSAQREFEALNALESAINVPHPIDRNRNVIVMSEIQGLTLSQCTLEHPQEALDQIMKQVIAAYRLGYIHGDLSEFNIMADGEEIWIIDWPQWIEPDHPNAETILRRDLNNVITFFARKYGTSLTTEEAYELVIG